MNIGTVVSNERVLQVNRVRELGAPGCESHVVTHTDAPELFVWNISSQPNRSPHVCAQLRQSPMLPAEIKARTLPASRLDGDSDVAEMAVNIWSAPL